ncbi:MAG: hypothetical protein GYA33_01460 [Thermogutta sp.]|nr:hypothetical protein [Thermogutta sp.]
MAPLELVIALPLLLFLMALMINFGTASAWRIRELATARQTVWASRYPRSLQAVPRPAYWPANAQLGVGGDPDATTLQDPRVDLPVMRGPFVGDFAVNRDLFDPGRHLRNGHAALTRDFPLLASLGPYRMDTETELLDNRWEFSRTGMSGNGDHRIPAIYSLPTAPPGYSLAYVQAARAILAMPRRDDLRVLDRDDEFAAYNARFGWGGGSPDFHPWLQRFCSLDRQTAQERVDSLIERIAGVRGGPGQAHVPSLAEQMARAFRDLYDRVIRELQNQLNAAPPPPPGQTISIQNEIADLQRKIDTLNAFLAILQNHGR